MLQNEETTNLVNVNPDKIEEQINKKPTKSKCVVYMFTLVTTIGGFLFGYDTVFKILINYKIGSCIWCNIINI